MATDNDDAAHGAARLARIGMGLEAFSPSR